jgi:hypothetical protein
LAMNSPELAVVVVVELRSCLVTIAEASAESESEGTGVL